MRKKGGWATAAPVEHPGQVVSRVDQQLIMTKPGDYLVTQGSLILAVVDEKTLENEYDTKQDGEMLIAPAIKRKLEDRLGLGSCANGVALLGAVERLAKISAGEIEIQFTPGQLEELNHRASKNNRTLTQELQIVVKRIEDELFHGVYAAQRARG